MSDNTTADAVHAQPINASLPNRYLTLLAIKLLKRWKKRSSSVLFLTNSTCVKYSRSTTLSEASTMQFIAQHTSIPVPRVHCAFERKGVTYIVMDNIRGKSLDSGWTRRSQESRTKVLDQLRSLVDEMRRVPPPPGVGVASVDGGPLYDMRLMWPSRFGPFSTVKDFHRHVRGGLEEHPDHAPEITELIAWHDNVRPEPVLTHGDISSFNVLAEGDRVVGIVDWETAGWWPWYWEYSTAWNANPQNEFWRKEVDRFLDPMPKEDLDNMLQQHRVTPIDDTQSWGLGGAGEGDSSLALTYDHEGIDVFYSARYAAVARSAMVSMVAVGLFAVGSLLKLAGIQVVFKYQHDVHAAGGIQIAPSTRHDILPSQITAPSSALDIK
ncbi:hypothetical protein OPT61_g6228 [Boeremia exigua]|uniref:Uncharacterized protein n=1 Tax=Boeremia exigua TaxID=749465 RepID=A0ACC2I7G7_9PLEO|nr:hypothetical protein OPT61_g6228 [Boeremia exigua]